MAHSNDGTEAQQVKLIECPRDSWQGMPQVIPTHIKADYLRSLARAGFKHIDAVSFVSAAAVPQMADSDEVMAALAEDGADAMAGVEIIAIVVNAKGVERALLCPLVTTLGFPYSVSPTFLRKNQKQTPEESLDVLEEMEQRADDEGRDVVAYVSMAFGNPYGDAWTVGETVVACELLADMGVTRISIADTVGVATAAQVEEVVAAVLGSGTAAEIGVHLHARPEDAAAKISAAYRAGCRRFDTALGGIGGCPFAQDALVGNIATETALEALRAEGADLPPLQSLETLQRAAAGIAARFGQPVVVQ
jgi:hydroxymethylglutaryl-CoA lyase